MKAKYSELFKDILKAYYNDNFDDKIKEIMASANMDKKELCSVISSLCGVELNYCDNYIEEIKKAIESYRIDHKVVNKVRGCSADCIDLDGKTMCQKSCPFDAILLDEGTHTSYIDDDRCTDCGFCVEACPTGALLDKVEFIPFVNLLKEHKPVIATVAPAIIGQFGEHVTMDQLRAAFMRVGFLDMVEVAFFADMLTLKEAVEFNAHVNKIDDFLITSCCCPMWVAMLKRVYNDLVPHVSPSISPMIASGRVLKALKPECKVVFIGPCVAKKAEAKEKDLLGDIDYVLTFAEMMEIFDALDIKPEELDEVPAVEYSSRGGRLYARTGGVSTAVSDVIEKMYPEKFELLRTVQGNGIKECKELLNKLHEGNVDANFIEGMGCIGGCVGGPKAIIPREEGSRMANLFAYDSEIKVPVESDIMIEILSKLNINSSEDFKDKSKIEIFEREF